MSLLSIPAIARWAGTLPALALLVACGVNKSPAKQYPVHATIVSVDNEAHLAKLNAGQIGDWMGPMTMDYPVPNKSDWDKLRTGQAIDATVFVRGDEFWVADVQPSAAQKKP